MLVVSVYVVHVHLCGCGIVSVISFQDPGIGCWIKQSSVTEKELSNGKETNPCCGSPVLASHFCHSSATDWQISLMLLINCSQLAQATDGRKPWQGKPGAGGALGSSGVILYLVHLHWPSPHVLSGDGEVPPLFGGDSQALGRGCCD